jgi:hypothetical protein
MEDSVNTHAIHTTDVLFSYYIVENIIHGTNEMERMLVSNSSSFLMTTTIYIKKIFRENNNNN